MNEIKTYWSKENLLYGSFDDSIIIESIDINERILIRPEEFEFLIFALFENWKKGESKYIQLLKEWNECIGFNGENEKPSIILDTEDTIKAIRFIKGVDEVAFGTVSKKDLKLILDFFIRNENNELKIWKD